MTYNPEGFDYAYSYVNIPGSVSKYANSGFFARDYALTKPTEDRATMMEEAMVGFKNTFEIFPGLTEKLRYYSRCIRDCFDTTGWPVVTLWEEVLQ